MAQVHPQPGIFKRSRLNVLLTENRPHAPEHWTVQLPRLLEPQGVVAYVARSGQEAIGLATRFQIHAAVVDLGLPVDDPSRPAVEGGRWLVEFFRRLPHQPPVVIINSPAYTDAQVTRLLQEALRLGAFSVLNKPVNIEQLLAVFQRMLNRRYQGAWPAPTSDS